MSEANKKRAAQAAMAELEPGMRIGLGTGSTAKHFVDLLGQKVANGFSCICVPTSIATETQARALGIPLGDLDELPELDLTVDGADEIDPDRNLIKGGGGALLREKIVAAASGRMVVIADNSKMVETLGRFPLPIEVNPFGYGATLRAIEKVAAAHKCEGAVEQRKGGGAEPFVTDGGHWIVDAFFGRIWDAQALSADLLNIPGVVQHGLFLNMCDVAYVAGPDADVTRLG